MTERHPSDIFDHDIFDNDTFDNDTFDNDIFDKASGGLTWEDKVA